MTDRELMHQALNALEVMRPACFAKTTLKAADTAITALRDRLAQPEQELVIDCPRCGHCCPQSEQEPVAWIQPNHLQQARRAPFQCRVEPTKRMSDFIPIYTTPPAAQRQPLTDERIALIAAASGGLASDFVITVARAIEAAHGIGEKK
jgi:hypothetical protein